MPNEVSFAQDKSIRGYPYRLISPEGDVLLIWTGKGPGWYQRAAWMPPLPGHLSGAEREAYQLAEASGGKSLTKLDLGVLVGFAYPLVRRVDWEGFFIFGPWMIHGKFNAAGDTPGSLDAHAVLRSMTFHEDA